MKLLIELFSKDELKIMKKESEKYQKCKKEYILNKKIEILERIK
jgi:hypothetical protein